MSGKPKDNRRYAKRNGGRNAEHGGRAEDNAKKSSVAENSAVPVLLYNAGTTSNFVEWKKKIAREAVKVYGDLGKCVGDTDDDYVVPPEVEPVDPAIMNAVLAPDDGMGIFRKQREANRFLKADEMRNKVIEDMRKDRSKLYAYIMTTISKESLAKISSVDDFPGVDDIMCPLSLMRLIEQTHQAPNTGAPIQDVTTAKNLYSDVKQGGRESLLDFFNRTKAALKMMEQLEIPDLPDNEVALNFISRLDKARFIELQTNIENQITPYPNDLQAAYVPKSSKLQSREAHSSGCYNYCLNVRNPSVPNARAR